MERGYDFWMGGKFAVKLLMENWREYLNEGMKTIDDIEKTTLIGSELYRR